MTEHIDRETFARLVRLGALEMDEEKSEYVRHELNNQLRAISQLQAIEIDADIEATIQGVEFTPEICQPLREDVIDPFSGVADLIALFPQSQDGYILVPDIPHTELE